VFVEGLQARLKVLGDEILRLTMLASEAPDNRQLYRLHPTLPFQMPN
jgi:hypothetical protein